MKRGSIVGPVVDSNAFQSCVRIMMSHSKAPSSCSLVGTALRIPQVVLESLGHVNEKLEGSWVGIQGTEVVENIPLR